MNENVFYHCAPIKLGAGSIIEPGNWGRLHAFHGWEAGIMITDYRELAIEFGRRSIQPSAPSRLHCVFAIETLENARNYAARHAMTSVIHRVQPVASVDQAVSLFRAKWSQFDEPMAEPTLSPLQALERDIQRYWQGSPDTDVEVLIGGAVRVLGLA